jgi:hypothetical protein
MLLLQNDLHIAILGSDSVVKLFNRFTLTVENAIRCNHDFDVNAMAFNQSGELLVTCRYNHRGPVLLRCFALVLLICITFVTELLMVLLLPKPSNYRNCSYSDWKLWDTRDRKLIESFDGHRSDVTGIAINNKGTGLNRDFCDVWTVIFGTNCVRCKDCSP